MSETKVFKIIKKEFGRIAIQLYNPLKDFEGVMHVLREGYMKDANTVVAFDMNTPEAAQARQEYEGLIKAVLSNGISLIARQLPSRKIIAYNLNRMEFRPQPGQLTFYEAYRNKCKTEIMKNVLNFRIEKDRQVNLYDMYNTDCIFETVYVATLPEFRNEQICFYLVENTIILAQDISLGKYPKTMAEEIKGKVPKIIFASTNSKYSERVVEKLNFTVVKIFPFKELKVNGVSLSEKVPPQHTRSTVNVFKL